MSEPQTIEQVCDELMGICPAPLASSGSSLFPGEFPAAQIAVVVQEAKAGNYTGKPLRANLLWALGCLDELVSGPVPVGEAAESAGIDPGSILKAYSLIKTIAAMLGWRFPF